jgi:hypothetical protein
MKDCKKIVTIPQTGPTCWFNALLMGFFYSQGMRRALFSCVPQWKSDNNEASELYKMFLDILVNSYIKKAHIQLLYPEKILKKFHKMDPEMFKHDPDIHEGGVADAYTNSLFKFFDLYDDTLFVQFTYRYDQKVFATKAPSMGILPRSRKMSAFPKVIVLEANHSLKNKTYIDWTLKDVVLAETRDHIKYVRSGMKTLAKDYIDIETGIMTYNEEKYIIDSVFIANFNSVTCSAGHAIAGVTCNQRKFIYNGWTMRTKDPGLKGANNLPINSCELMAYDWLDDDNTYCINKKMCNMRKATPGEDSDQICFNFHKGYRAYYAVRADLITKKIKKDNNKLACPPEFYDFKMK